MTAASDAFDTLSRSGLDMLATGDTLIELFAYAADPTPWRAAENARRDQFNAAMAPHYARVRAEQEARWAADQGDAA